MPEIGVCPPDWMLMTVRMVAPAGRQPRHQPRADIGHPLTNEFTVGVVVGLTEVVGDQGGQERIDGPEQRQHASRPQQRRPVLLKFGTASCRPPSGMLPILARGVTPSSLRRSSLNSSSERGVTISSASSGDGTH